MGIRRPVTQDQRISHPQKISGRIAVLGLGNILLTDEGIGVHTIHALKSRFVFSPEIAIIDGGTMGLDLLPIFQDYDKIVIIDAADFGKTPGYIEIRSGDGISSVLNTKFSVHHLGLSDVLFAIKLMQETIPDICFIGIQPQSLAVGLIMTQEIGKLIEPVIAHALHKLADWGVQSHEQLLETVPASHGFFVLPPHNRT
jgi:hydrogenase maturation protease